MRKTGLIIFVALALSACDKVKSCNTSSSTFQKLFNSTIHGNTEDKVTMDTEVHSYTFKVDEDQIICKIGYQSYSELKNVNYTIEIKDETNGSDYASFSSKFKSNKTSYIPIKSGFQLKAGHIYSIKRIQTDWGQYISNTVGRIAIGDVSLPIEKDGLTILSSSYHDADSSPNPTNTDAIPYIDIIFAKKP